MGRHKIRYVNLGQYIGPYLGETLIFDWPDSDNIIVERLSPNNDFKVTFSYVLYMAIGTPTIRDKCSIHTFTMSTLN